MVDIISVPSHEDTASIDAEIKAILDRGNIVRFSAYDDTVIKHVDKWVTDAETGDLVTCWMTPNCRAQWVCQYACHYTMTEITPEQANAERSRFKTPPPLYTPKESA
jgi:hypothetical protein